MRVEGCIACKPDLEKYKQLKDKSIETINISPASFTDFYKNKVNEYFFNQ